MFPLPPLTASSTVLWPDSVPPAAENVPAPMPLMLIPTVPPLELTWSSATSGAFGCVVGPLVRSIAGPAEVMSASPELLTVTLLALLSVSAVPVVVRLTSSSVSDPFVLISETPVVGDDVVVTLSIVPDSAVPGTLVATTRAGPAADVSEIVPVDVKLTVPALLRLTAVPPVVLTVRSLRSQVPVVVFRSGPPAPPDSCTSALGPATSPVAPASAGAPEPAIATPLTVLPSSRLRVPESAGRL